MLVKFCDNMTAVVPVEKIIIEGVRNGEEIKEGDCCLVKWKQKYEAFLF